MLRRLYGWLVGNRPETPPESPATQRQERERHQSSQVPSPGTSAVATGATGASSTEADAIDYFNNKHRKKAEEEDRLMRECYDKATKAREKGDHEGSNRYVEEAKKHNAEKEAAHKRGMEYVLNNNPTNRKKDVVDLHGLRVDEALGVVEERIAIAKELNYKKFHIITGRGNHSLRNQPKIKPKIKELLKRMNYKFEEDKDNPGSLTVHIN